MAEARENLEKIRAARERLRNAREIPFVWDISFVEIFADDREGFDIIVGNPPYVRQENIAHAHLEREAVNAENKKVYKDTAKHKSFAISLNLSGDTV
ncbi:MAG: Eco57I restriction-modification methylase domain-containing protein [Acidobacteriota bacterium]|nr:Eco57I restriction-modification methylase domain-containing protein [Acidobacteriota bacterium]